MLNHGYVDPDELEETVRERFWTEYEAAQYYGARMTILPPRYFEDKVLAREDAERYDPHHVFTSRYPGGDRWETVRAGLASHCAGMRPRMPGPREFEKALQADDPDDGDRHLIRVWIEEVSWTHVMGAWFEGAYSWAALARAAGRSGGACCRHGFLINGCRNVSMLPDVRLEWSPRKLEALREAAMDAAPPRRHGRERARR